MLSILGDMPGAILYEGPSILDKSPIVVIATSFKRSRNVKTGNMVQTWILRSDIHPIEAWKSGTDVSICGDCIHRGTWDGERMVQRTCYVQWNPIASVYRTYKNGRYKHVTAQQALALGTDRFIRLGSYGDPAAVPFEVWDNFLTNSIGRNGYTHQWRTADPRFASVCMASADTPSDVVKARALGYRTFRVRPDAFTKLPNEVVCPASAEAGHKTQCLACKACGGTGSKAKADITITLHGGNAVTGNAKRRGLLETST